MLPQILIKKEETCGRVLLLLLLTPRGSDHITDMYARSSELIAAHCTTRNCPYKLERTREKENGNPAKKRRERINNAISIGARFETVSGTHEFMGKRFGAPKN